MKSQGGSIQIFLDTDILATEGCRSFRRLVDCIRTGISEPIERDVKIGSRLHRFDTQDKIISVSPDIVLISSTKRQFRKHPKLSALGLEHSVKVG